MIRLAVRAVELRPGAVQTLHVYGDLLNLNFGGPRKNARRCDLRLYVVEHCKIRPSCWSRRRSPLCQFFDAGTM